MNISLTWHEKMLFSASTAQGINVKMDALAPFGQHSAQTPKELIISGLCGCTGMDVIAWLRKYKQEPSRFEIKAEISKSEGGNPAVFTAAKLNYFLEGEVDPARALEAVQLSQTEYCGVSAMLSKSFPIFWEVFVNELSVGKGQAKFSKLSAD